MILGSVEPGENAARIERPAEAVTVFLSDRKYERPRPFYCLSCGKRVFDLYSPVRLIVDGAVLARDQGTGQGTVVKCKQCKMTLTVL